MNNNNPEILELLKRIEQTIDFNLKSPADFDKLSGIIWERTHENISPSTLKRLWGYFDGVKTIRNSTLVILSKYLGYKGWNDYLAHLNQDNGSDPVLSPVLKTEDLEVGDRVTVSWKPNRRCTFRYLGSQQFIVEKAVNSKLKAGNTFCCSVFIVGAPLYLTNLVQDDQAPATFVAGKKDGLCEVTRS